jgi:hypothetical protein
MPTTLNSTELKTNNIVLQDVLDITKDIVISADFSCFGSSVDGGEGFSFYLYGGYTLDQSIGSPGPGLGYAPTDALVEVDGNDIFSGVNNAVLGVGFDIVGDFALPLGGPVWGDALAHPNAVTLRKGSADKFEYIGSSSPLSDFNFNIYQVYGDACPSITSTPTPTRTVTPTQTFTNTWGSTATATPTQTQTPTRTATQTQTSTPTTTRTNSQTPTRTKTRTPSSTHTTTYTKSQTPLPSKSITRTQTPTNTLTQTPTRTVSPTQTPTKTGLHPTKKSVKVRITNFGKKAIVYVRNSTCGEFVKVYEKDLLGLTIPAGNHVMVGLSYSTGARCSKFYIYKFEVNGIGFENQYTPTQTRTMSKTPTPTQTSTQNPTPTQTRTRTPTPSSTTTRTPTQTPTQTQTRTQTRTETPRVSQTQTRTQTRTQSPTQTQTRTQSPTRTQTSTQTPTQTRTSTKPIPAVFSTDGSFMFRFTSLFYRAANFDMAVKIMINNGRYVFNTNQTTSSLFDWNGEGVPDVTGGGDFAVPYCQQQVNPRGDFAWCGTLCGSPTPRDPAGNNYYTQAFFYDGPSVDGQKNNIQGGDGETGWRGTRLLPFSTKRDTNNSDFTHRTGGTTPPIPQNVWDALQSLFTSGGTTYDDCKLSLTATDDSQAFGGGQNYNVWPVENINEEKNNYNLDTQNYQIAQGRLDQRGCAYNFPNGTTEQILYNFDNITGSPILPGVEKSRDDFEKRYDVNRTLPNTRYLRIKDGDIDITFSYVTELIQLQEGDTRGVQYDTTGRSYLGARITLWTGSYQGNQPVAGKEPDPLFAGV